MASVRYNGVRFPLMPPEAVNCQSWFIDYYPAFDIELDDGVIVHEKGAAMLRLWDSLPYKVDYYTEGSAQVGAFFSDGTVMRYYNAPFPCNDGDEWELISTEIVDSRYFTYFQSITAKAFYPDEDSDLGWTISNLTLTMPDGTVLCEACESIVNADESLMLGIAVGMALYGGDLHVK